MRRRLAVVVAVMAALAVWGGTPAVAAPTPAATGKYYVVGRPSQGQREYLYEIAAKTLGNGNRYTEIFDLNKNRVQSDGGRLTDPLVLSPGWILVLPRDAKGVGVRTGTPPVVHESVSPPPASAPPPPSTSAPSPPSASASPPAASVFWFRTDSPVVTLGGVSLALLLLIVAVPVLQGRRRAGRKRWRTLPIDDGLPGLPPGEAPARSIMVPMAGASPPAQAAPRQAQAAPQHAPAAPQHAPAAPQHAPAAPAPARAVAAPARAVAAPALAEPAAGAGATTLPRRQPAPVHPNFRISPGSFGGFDLSGRLDSGPPGIKQESEKPMGTVELYDASQSGADRDVPDRLAAAPSEGGDAPDCLTAELVVDGNRIEISVVGVTGDGPGRPYGWRAATQAPPAAGVPVMLGESDGRRLFLDLGRCPDVLTVVGDLPDCEKYALRLIQQSLANGHGVAVLGDDLFRDGLPAECRRIGTMADARSLDELGIVVCGRLVGEDLASARLSRASGGPIPVLVGEVPGARWSVRVVPN